MQVLVKSSLVNGDRIVQPEWTCETLKSKLEFVTGIPPEHQRIYIETNGIKREFSDGKLASMSLNPNSVIEVDDSRPENEQLTFEPTEKYEMPLEEYERRDNTLLAWKRKNMLGRFKNDARHVDPVSVSDDSPLTVQLGDECIVTTSANELLRGEVAFIGEVPTVEPGIWIGVRLPTPSGRNNGTVRGMRLFDAELNHGILVRSRSVRPLNNDEQEL